MHAGKRASKQVEEGTWCEGVRSRLVPGSRLTERVSAAPWRDRCGRGAAGSEPSVGSRGDSYDYALPDTRKAPTA
jgi:hypothetical protein